MASEAKNLAVNFTSGGFALATAFAVMHPLDTLKTQLQTNSFVSYRTLSRGFLTSFLLAAPQGGLRLSSYEFTKKFLSKGNESSVILISAVSACVGDTVSSIVKVPREVITARLQSGVDKEILSKSKVSPALGTFRLIVRDQGVRGLFKGFFSTTLRDWPFMVILFSSYETFKKNHHRFTNSDEEEDLTTMKSTFYGGVSGILYFLTKGALAGFLTTPFDVIKTKIMTSSGTHSTTIPSIARQISRSGFNKFFVGGSARTVWWYYKYLIQRFCVCSIFFPLYEGGKYNMHHLARTGIFAESYSQFTSE